MDKKISAQTKALLIAYKAQLICLKGVQADIQRRIESIQKEMDEVMEIIRKKENKPEQPAKKRGSQMVNYKNPNDSPIGDGHDRIQVLGNLWADVDLSTGWIDKYIGCVDIVKISRNRRKIKEIVRCEIKRIKRQNLYK